MNKLFGTYVAALGIVLSAAVALVGLTHPASAVVDNSPDCNNVAVIRCGAFDTDTLRKKASQNDVPTIYNHMGISQDDLKGQFVNGIVWRDGRVTVDGKVVATNAMTAGRNFGGTPIPGTNNAGTYSTSRFTTEGQTAFVKMKANGTFDFAIIKSCGNPIKATPKTPQQSSSGSECTRLTVEKISRTKYKFTADAKAASGATIQQYEFGFGDGFGITVADNTYTYDYKKTGTFNTNVVVHVMANGVTRRVTSPQCEKTITVQSVQTTPQVCIYDSSLPKDSPKCVKPVTSVAYCTIAGKTNLPADSPECVATTSIDYCTIAGKTNLPANSPECVAPVEYCTIAGKTNLPVDSPECVASTTIEYCTIKGKENLLKSSAECRQDEVVPLVMASTGPGAIIGGLAGSTFLGYGAYAFAQSRRFLISKHLSQ